MSCSNSARPARRPRRARSPASLEFTLLCAFAPNAEVFGLLRFLAGLGLGGCLPTAITLVTEHQESRGRGARASTPVMTGYHVGAVLTSLLDSPHRTLRLARDVRRRGPGRTRARPPDDQVPPGVRELRTQPRRRPACPRRAAGLFQNDLLRATLAFWCTTFLGLILVFGLNTSLSQIMRQAGYPLGAALGLLLTLNAGAIAGMVIAGEMVNRRGLRRLTVGWFVAAGVFLALLAVCLPAVGPYAVVLLAGFFVSAPKRWSTPISSRSTRSTTGRPDWAGPRVPAASARCADRCSAVRCCRPVSPIRVVSASSPQSGSWPRSRWRRSPSNLAGGPFRRSTSSPHR
jgi:hypothetical protein